MAIVMDEAKQTTNEPKPKRKRGRPKGSTKKSVAVVVYPSKCSKCGSTERTPFNSQAPIVGPWRAPDGTRWRKVRKRRCKCLGCGQVRIEHEPHDKIEPNNSR